MRPRFGQTFSAMRIDSSHDAVTQAGLKLRQIAGADASGVRVFRDGDAVRLTGRVPHWHVKQLAAATVRRYDSEAQIENDLLVCN